MKRSMAVGLMLLAAGTSAQAADQLDTIDALNQSNFRLLSEDLGAALSYKAVIPAEPLGIAGFDVGITFSETMLENEDVFDAACGGCGNSNLYIPKLQVHKGLPLGFDVGIMYASTGNTDLSLTGFELRYANIEGGVTTPAVATRFTYSKLSGVDQLDFNTMGLEVTVSKGFAMFTPYAGIGQNWVTSTPKDVAGSVLEEEKFTQVKYYAGLNINLAFINLGIEADQTGDAQTYSGKIGFRF